MTKKINRDRARPLLHHALADMRRMDFALLNMLVYAASGDKYCLPSDMDFHQLKLQAKAVLKNIKEAEVCLAPYLTRRLRNPGSKRPALPPMRTIIQGI